MNKMTLKEAFDIINYDDDYLDITKWTKKHFVSQRMYNLYVGLTPRESRKVIKTIKKASKALKKVRKEYERRGISIEGPVRCVLEDEERVYLERGNGVREK